MGIPVGEIALMSLSLIEAVVEENNRRAAREAGRSAAWDAESLPEPDDAAPPDRGHFLSYGCGLGLSPEAAAAEYDRQLARGGADLSLTDPRAVPPGQIQVPRMGS